MVAIRHIVFYDFYRVRRANHGTAMARHTLSLISQNGFFILREKMHLVRAFLDACTAKRTAVAVSLYIKFGNGKIHYLSPSLANGINIGVPPSTAAIFRDRGKLCV